MRAPPFSLPPLSARRPPRLRQGGAFDRPDQNHSPRALCHRREAAEGCAPPTPPLPAASATPEGLAARPLAHLPTACTLRCPHTHHPPPAAELLRWSPGLSLRLGPLAARAARSSAPHARSASASADRAPAGAPNLIDSRNVLAPNPHPPLACYADCKCADGETTAMHLVIKAQVSKAAGAFSSKLWTKVSRHSLRRNLYSNSTARARARAQA